MFRFLLLEDVTDTREQLVKLLREVFIDVEIDEAETVVEAMAHVQRRQAQRIAYDVAILDFRVPYDIDMPDAVDTKMCAYLKQEMPGIPVVHISSLTENADVVQHLREAHSTTETTPAVLVDKSEAGWAGKLIDDLERYLYSATISSGLDSLFGSDRTSAAVGRRYGRPGHLSQELKEFSISLERLWGRPLDQHVRERVLRHFDHSSVGGDDRFSLKIPDGIE
jgi:CheY-like chemotaxis protein